MIGAVGRQRAIRDAVVPLYVKAAMTAAGTKKTAQQFEGVLISQMLNEMFEGIKTDGMFGGGPGEEMFRSLMIDEYGKQVAAQGGLGLSDHITRALLQRQEIAS